MTSLQTIIAHPETPLEVAQALQRLAGRPPSLGLAAELGRLQERAEAAGAHGTAKLLGRLVEELEDDLGVE